MKTAPSATSLRRGVRIASLIIVAVIGLYFGLTTSIDRSPILGSDTARASEQLLNKEAERIRTTPLDRRPLRVGWSIASITPPLGAPTYGYSARRGRGIETISDSTYVYALALAAGNSPPVVFLTADICTWVDDISHRISTELAPLLARERLYFAVTHTHSGPGGYGRGPIDAWLMGGFDITQCNMLVRAAVDATRNAMDNLAPGGYREHVTRLPEFVVNRIERSDPVDDELLFVEYVKESGARCAFVSYSAHATTIGPESGVCSGDYPATIRKVLLQHGYSLVLFISSSTGQAGPAFNGLRVSYGDVETAKRYGSALSERILALASASSEPFLHNMEITPFMSTIRLPKYQYRTMGLVLRPWVTGWLIGSPNPLATIQAFRLGGSLYINHSFEFSGVIAHRLKRSVQSNGRHLLITGFNGVDYLYVVPEQYYDRDTYEGSLSLFGPHLGSYLEKMTAQLSSFMFSLGGPDSVRFDLSTD